MPTPSEAIAAVPSAALLARIAELPDLLNGRGNFETFFTPMFQRQVPRAQFEQTAAQMVANVGKAQAVSISEQITPNAASLTVRYARGTAEMRIFVTGGESQSVLGLALVGFTSDEPSLKAVRDSIQRLPGRSAFLFARLDDEGTAPLIASRADQPFAVGSAFKLLILAALLDDVRERRRTWRDFVTIDGAPLPAGGFNLLPRGMRVPLQNLALRMIAASDNSATDILLHLVGRDRVEAMMARTGVDRPARAQPLLSTMEMFKLKGIDGGALGARYARLDEPGRRVMLAGEVARASPNAIDPMLFRDRKPIMVEQVEWMFTASDLARIMNWLRLNSEGEAGVPVREILSANAGIAQTSARRWDWVGYKGGSEPGVLNMTLMMRSKAGDWYVLVASWNNADRDVDQDRLTGLMSRAAQLAAPPDNQAALVSMPSSASLR